MLLAVMRGGGGSRTTHSRNAKLKHGKINKWMDRRSGESRAPRVCAVEEANTTGNSVRAVVKMHNFEGE